MVAGVETPPVCPRCGRADRAHKVSFLYLEGTARLHQSGALSQSHLDALLSDLLPNGSPAEKKALSSRLVAHLAPPSGASRVTRPIHPDWMIIFLCAVGLVIAYRVFAEQPEIFPVVVTVLGAALLLYLLARRPVLARFTGRARQEAERKRHVEQSVERWMRLYCCACEPCIFDPASGRCEPLDGLSRLLAG